MARPDMEDQEEMEVEDNVEKSNEIRKEYRSIREQINEDRMAATDPNSNLPEKFLENIQGVFRKVEKAREAVSDNKALLEVALLGKERIKNIHCEFRAFSNLEFMDKLKSFMAGFDKKSSKKSRSSQRSHDDDEDQDPEMSDDETFVPVRSTQRNPVSNRYVLTKPILTGFGKEVMNYFRIAPKPTFLLGSLDKQLPTTVKKVRQKREVQRNVEAKETKIKELNAESEENDKNGTVNEIERIFRILKKYYMKYNAPLCLYEFMVNPHSFSRTIENIFYVSFLVKDGYAKISIDKTDQLPTIVPLLENEPTSFEANDMIAKKKSNQSNVQCMISMTKLEWKEIIEVFNISEPMIPEPKNKNKAKK